MNIFPRVPTGQMPLVESIRRLIKLAEERNPIDSVDIKWERSPNGMRPILKRVNSSPAAEGEPGTLNQYLVKDIQDDYLLCRKMNGITEEAVDVLIAKPWDLRKTPFHGVTIDYDIEFSANVIRIRYEQVTAVSRLAHIINPVGLVSASERQVIIPRYQPNQSVIYAMNVEETMIVTGAATSKVDVNGAGRAWAHIF